MADNPRIEELRRRVHTDPASIAFAQLAEEYRRAGCCEEAVQVCRAGLERHPSYLSARVTLGRALIELEHYDDARAELEYVLRSAPENLAAIRGLAEIHQRRGNLSEALRQYQSALAIARHDPELEESVDDLTRQLGGARPTAPVIEPPLPAIDLSEPVSQPFTASRGEVPDDSGPSTTFATSTSLSPELEAAADEFTKALQALDALGLDLPDSRLADDQTAPDSFDPPSTEPATHDPDSVAPVVLEGHQAEPSGDVMAVEAAPHREIASPDPQEAKVVNELESWLDAIVLDRSEREAALARQQGEEDLPLNTP